MKAKRKKLHEQVVVITGATSGIGLATARRAAARGARVVLAARDEEALQQLAREIESTGREALYVVADVGREEDVRRVAEAAVTYFGGFDSWINNAAVSIYGTLVQIPLEEQRRLFDTNFWGVVHGSRVAAEHLRARGGALINVGSILSDRAVPLQGPYSASKHAVKGFTDALRMELEREGAPISVTLIKPSAIDTPYVHHAKNYLPEAPQNPPPYYAPDVVAEAILSCAEHPKREVVVGGTGKLFTAIGTHAPRLTDWMMERTMPELMTTGEPPGRRERHNLFAPRDNGGERSGTDHYVAERSLYTKAVLHPVAASVVLLGAGLLVALAAYRRR